MNGPDVSLVVLSWNTKDLTLACLAALRAETPRYSREVIVIDNGSHDGSADAVAEVPDVRLIRNADNRGYAGGNNQGAELAEGRLVCLLNSDTEVRPGAIDHLVEFLDGHPEYGAVAPKLLNVDGTIQTACMRFPGLLVALCYDSIWGKFWPGKWVDDRYYMRDFDHEHSRDVDQPPGACFMMRRREYLDMGGLDAKLYLFFNDVDLCRRLWKGDRRIRYLAAAEVVHHGGASTQKFHGFVITWFRNRIAYYRKHYGPLAVPYLHLILRMRALEEWFKAGSRCADPEARRAERAEIRRYVREILAP
ncbi:MAG: glycosyltransferase family 2 protein [Planctomycetota bacterium]